MRSLKETFFITPILLTLGLIGFIISFIFFINVQEQQNKQIEEKFMHIFQRHTNSFQRELDLNIQILHSIERFFSSSKNINRDEFKTYVKFFLNKYKSIQALEWIPKVKYQDRIPYEEKAKKELNIDFHIKEKFNSKIIIAKKRDFYYPVYYLEPLKGNLKVLGFDLASNKTRLDSINKAINTKDIAITDKITLIQEKAKQSGFLIFIPVLDKEEVRGFILGVYHIGDMIETAYNYNKIDSSMITTWLVDETKENKKDLLFTNSISSNNYNQSRSLKINLHDKKWVLYAKPTQVFLDKNRSYFPYFTLLAGCLLNILLMYIFSLKIKQNIQLQNSVDKKTNDLLLSNRKLEGLNKTLNIKIKDGIEENRKKDQLLLNQSKLASMGEMIGAIAHQWRQPLNTLALQIQFLEDDFDANEIDKDYIKTLDKKCMHQIKYMSKTIDDFKNFYISDKKAIDFSVSEKIIESLNLIKAQLDSLDISISLQDSNIFIYGFQNEFSQVILNIINNAKDAIVERKIQNGQISIVILEKKDFIIITIEDNAGGIPTNIIEKIFDPYFTTKEQGKGTGIGLYMSKVIIETNMKGQLSIENINDGACFTIKLGKKNG